MNSSAQRVSDYRSRMRAKGYRQVAYWVPDVRTEQFHKEAHRQSALLAEHDSQHDNQQFLDALMVETFQAIEAEESSQDPDCR